MNTFPQRSIAVLLIGATAIGHLMLGSLHVAQAEMTAPQALTCNAISGYVYEDANFNGLRDTNEPPLTEVKVDLLNAADAVIASATTDATGFYSFTIDTTVIQSARHITQSLVVDRRTTDWTREFSVNQFNPALGELLIVSVTTTGQLTSLVRVENTDSSAQVLTATVAARFTAGGPALTDYVAKSPLQFIGVFQAQPFDGLIDFHGVSGIEFPTKTVTATATLNLTDSLSLANYVGTSTLTMSLSTVGSSSSVGSSNVNLLLATSASGELDLDYGYIPSRCIKAGRYTIHESQPPAYDDGMDTAGNVTPIPGSSGGHDTIPVQVTTGDSIPNNNFGEWRPASIGGFVYHDISDDGAFDANESPIPQAVVRLTGVSITGTLVSITQTTSLTGSYLFSGLWPGTYTLTEVQPPVWRDGRDTQGTPGGGTATNDQFASIHLDAGVIGKDNNFGELLPIPALTLIKTVGTTPNTCALTSMITVTAGTQVYYCYKVTNIGQVNLITHTLIDDKLGVLLNNVVINLAPGASTFVTAPATIQITTTNVATWTARPPFGPPVTTTTTATVTVPPVLATASLGDFVWMDTDNDGVQDPDEPGASKTRVTLYSNGVIISKTITTWQGYYTFTKLTPGVPYTLNFDYTMKQGMTWTVRYAGTDRSKDSNINKAGNTDVIILKPNEFNRTIDAGIDLGLLIDQVAVDAAIAIGQCADRLITYTLVVDNNGIFTLDDIMLYDQMPAGTTYVANSASVPPTIEQMSLTWQLPVLKPGDRFSVSFVVKVALSDKDSDSTTFVNSAYIGNTDFPVLSTTINNKTLTCRDKPTAVSLLRFEAAATGDGVRVDWATALEVDTLGFALYRSDDGQRAHAVRVTVDLIAGTGRDGGARYSWLDTAAQSGVVYHYWLQEMTLSGVTNDYGPAVLPLAAADSPVTVDAPVVAVDAGGVAMGVPAVALAPINAIAPAQAAPVSIVAPAVAAPVIAVSVAAAPTVAVPVQVSPAELRSSTPLLTNVDSSTTVRPTPVDAVHQPDSVVVAPTDAPSVAVATPVAPAAPVVSSSAEDAVRTQRSVVPVALAVSVKQGAPSAALAHRLTPSAQTVVAVVEPVLVAWPTIGVLMVFSGFGAVVMLGLSWLGLAAVARRWLR